MQKIHWRQLRNPVGIRLRVVDDDLDLKNMRPLDGNELDLYHLAEDAPQIAGIIDERPDELRALEEYGSKRWKVVADENGMDNIKVTRIGGVPKINPTESKSSLCDELKSGKPRLNESLSELPAKTHSMQTSSKESPSRKSRRKDDSDTSPPRKSKNKYDSDVSPPRKTKNKYDSDASPPRKSKNKYDSDESPPRKVKRKCDSGVSPPRKSKNKYDSDASPLRKSNKYDSDASPLLKSHKYGPDVSPTRKLRRKDDSDPSPPRKSRRDDSDPSPPRKSKRKDDSDPSPPRKSRRKGNSDVSPIRTSKNKYDYESPRKSRRKDDSDSSPPRKSKIRYDSDVSPLRRTKPRDDFLRSPPSRKSGKYYNQNVSPVRKSKAYADSDYSPPRKPKQKYNESSPKTDRYFKSQNATRSSQYHGNSLRRVQERDSTHLPHKDLQRDLGPARKPSRWETLPENKSSKPHHSSYKDERYNHHSELLSKQSSGSDSNSSPPRKLIKSKTLPDRSTQHDAHKRPRKNPDSDDSAPRDRENRTERREGDSRTKVERTLDGRKAGLQDARELKKEIAEFKHRENEVFEKMDPSVSGLGAAPVMRDRKTGKRRDLEQESKDRKEEDKRTAEHKAKYTRWGKGLKQVKDHEDRLQQDLHEMTKPLARYADDDDLERHLREQEREGDPMLEYLRSKAQDCSVKGNPVYQGSLLPNRFSIRPGHRWDGVDRSSGYEKQWFEHLNAKRAVEEEAYKWSTSDM